MLHAPISELPHDIETEQAILGAVLVKNDAMTAFESLAPGDFFDPIHQDIWHAMQQQWANVQAINAVSLRAILQELPDIADNVSPTEYIRRLVSIGDTSNLHALAEAQREMAQRRSLCKTAIGLDACGRNLSADVRFAAGYAVEELDEVLSATRTRGPTRKRAGEAFIEMLDSLKSDDGSSRISSGLTSLDSVTGGWRRQQFAILAGRPSMGKSTVVTSAMLRTARAGVGVLMFSLEMPHHALAARCLSDLSYSANRPIPYAAALAGHLEERDQHLWAETAARFEMLPLVVDDQRGLTVAEIAARTRAEAQRMERDGHKLGLVVVDHLGLVRPSERYAGNKVQEVGEISDALATLAKDQDVAVLALHQLNRGTEARENKRPTLADLRNSGDLEQDADLVIFAYREAYYLERTKCDVGSQMELQRQTELEACRNTLELLIAKNRNGPTTTVTLFCDMACNAVRDLAR